MNSEINALLTARELCTLGGAVGAVVVMTNGLHYAFGLTPKYVGLILSFLVSLFIASVGSNTNWTTWALAIPNAFLIYCSAAGVSVLPAGSKSEVQSTGEAEELILSRKIWPNWF